jgi:hypothetical protein
MHANICRFRIKFAPYQNKDLTEQTEHKILNNFYNGEGVERFWSTLTPGGSVETSPGVGLQKVFTMVY